MLAALLFMYHDLNRKLPHIESYLPPMMLWPVAIKMFYQLQEPKIDGPSPPLGETRN